MTGSTIGVGDVTRRSLRHGFLRHTTTNFKLSNSAPNYNANVIKHKAVSMIQCACFCLNYPVCKSPLCVRHVCHIICGSAACLSLPHSSQFPHKRLDFFLGGGGTWNACFSLLYNVYLIRCSILLIFSANYLITFSDFNQIKFSGKKMTKVLNTTFCENSPSGSPVFPFGQRDGQTDTARLTAAIP